MMLNQSGIQKAKAIPELSVHYKEDATYVYVYHPNFYLRIVKPRQSWQPGGRIDIIMFKGKPIVNTDDPRFGSISVLNATDVTQTQWMLPATMSLVSAVGNDTDKLVLTLATSSITLFDGTGALPVNVTVEYTFYGDIDNIFIWVTLDSTLTAWRLDSSTTYGQSLALLYFQNYEVKGTRNTVISQGSLTGTTSQDFVFTATHAQITVKNTTNNVAVTMFPLGLFPPLAWVRDRPALTWIYFEIMRSRTWDGSWYEWGQNIRNITYGTGIALHDADVLPQVVTPWLMPNAVPYGIMQSYDELPANTYNRIQPDPTYIEEDMVDAYTFWYWHEQNPEAKINLMLALDMLEGGYTPTEGGVDRSWEAHGDIRLANASIEWKNWLKSIEGTWIGYGIHAYHHDYPWMYEFSTVTNATWIDATWNQINEDVRAIGLKNQTWFKAAGYRMLPQGLDILIKYGMQGYNSHYEEPPTATAQYFHVDPQGRKLILFSNSLSPDTYLVEGKSPSYIYNNLIKGNLTKLGLLSMSGHFINQTIYPEWKELFDLISAEFNVHYFLVEEIIDYWYKVLLPLKYTYNSTTITKNVNDSRLTFRLINSPIPITSGLRYDDTTFTLYSPNMETDDFESGDFSAWSWISVSGGETVTVVTTDPHHGIYHAKASCDGSSTGEYAQIGKDLASASSIIYIRGYFKFKGTLPSLWYYYEPMGCVGTGGFVAKVQAGTWPEGVRWFLKYLRNGTEVELVDTVGPSLDTWYCIELYAKVGTTDGAVKLYINGQERLSDSGFDNDDYGNINNFRVGERWSSGQTAHDVYVDSVVVADAYIGP